MPFFNGLPVIVPVFALNFVPAGKPAAVTLFVVGAIVTFTLMLLPMADATELGAARGFPLPDVGAAGRLVVAVADVVGAAVVVDGAAVAVVVDVVVPDSVDATVDDVAGTVVLDSGDGAEVSGDDDDGDDASVDVEVEAVVKVNAEVCLATTGQPTAQQATSRK